MVERRAHEGAEFVCAKGGQRVVEVLGGATTGRASLGVD